MVVRSTTKSPPRDDGMDKKHCSLDHDVPGFSGVQLPNMSKEKNELVFTPKLLPSGPGRAFFEF